MKHKIYIDGQVGTTGLRILDQLSGREDLELLRIDEDKRKDPQERARLLNEADVAVLCLPDEASIEAVSFLEPDSGTRILDASTAHRVGSDWAYGIPELSPAHRQAIASAPRVSNPGCHASGFNLAVFPLVQGGIVPRGYPFTCTSLTGYSGGGKPMIADYEDPDPQPAPLRGSRPYALSLTHKHLPEMKKHSNLEHAPLFSPAVGAFHSGMIVSVPILPRLLPVQPDAKILHEFLQVHYQQETFVKVAPFSATPDVGFLDPQLCNGTNQLDLFVFGNDEHILICARFDNLGKGASGAAVQNLNLMLGRPEETGLVDS